MKIPRLSTRTKASSGYILLLILLVSVLYGIVSTMESLTAPNQNEVKMTERRRCTNEVIYNLYQAEIISHTISSGELSVEEEYFNKITNAKNAIVRLRELVPEQEQQRLDSLNILIDKKTENQRNLINAIRNNRSDELYQGYIEELISHQDTMTVVQPIIRHTEVVRTNTYTVHTKRKKFFGRLRDAFKRKGDDTAHVSNVTREQRTDSIAPHDDYNPKDTVVNMLITAKKRIDQDRMQRIRDLSHKVREIHVNGMELSQKLNDLLKTLAEETRQAIVKREAEHQKIKMDATKRIAGTAIIAVLLASFFLVLIWRDITRSNHYRHELEKAKLRAEDLLNVREKLMLTITHDIKAPVGSIIGFADLLENSETNPKSKTYLKNMQSSAHHLLQLVNSLLDFHRLEANKMDINNIAYNPKELLDTIYLSYQPITRAKGLELKYDCAPELDSYFVSDPFRIRQIAENLMSNAVKFTDKGFVSLSAKISENCLLLAVEDSGRGISEQDKERIFHEFTRLGNAQGQEGFGLGLAITHKLVQLLNGEISIDSTPGKGTTFYIWLPLTKATENDIALLKSETDSATHNIALKHRKLILIDDDRLQLQLTAAMLTDAGAEITTCETPDKLFQLLMTNCYNAVLTDIQMPAMNGFELLKAIRNLDSEQAKTIPVIAITARSDMSAESLAEKGFAGCLHKPFTRKEIAAALGSIDLRDCEESQSPAEDSKPSEQEPSAESRPKPVETATDFSPLLLFASGDTEAEREIMQTFIYENTAALERIRLSLSDKDMKTLTATAHKLLPTMMMLGFRYTNLLTDLNGKRDLEEMSDADAEAGRKIADELQKIVDDAHTVADDPSADTIGN